jgi:hypothetical protein
VDHPVLRQRDADVVDAALGRLGPERGRAEEQQVPRAHVREAEALALADLACHLSRGAPADARAGRVPGQLEDAPDEPRAVIAAVRLVAEGARDGVGLAAPDVRHADLRDRDAQRAAGLRAVGREVEGREPLAGVLDGPAAGAQHRGERVSGLGARDRLPWVQLTRVVGRRVVGAQAELARDDLGTERARRAQAGPARDALHVGGDAGEAELGDQAGVEGTHGDRGGGGPGDGRLPAAGGERAERGPQLRARERALAVEAAVAEAGEDAGGGDRLLLVGVPVRVRGESG